jgi:hypothetical protein
MLDETSTSGFQAAPWINAYGRAPYEAAKRADAVRAAAKALEETVRLLESLFCPSPSSLFPCSVSLCLRLWTIPMFAGRLGGGCPCVDPKVWHHRGHRIERSNDVVDGNR